MNRDVQNEIRHELQTTKEDEFFVNNKNSLVLLSETKHEMFQVNSNNTEIKTKLGKLS
jgi:hypothetical protein